MDYTALIHDFVDGTLVVGKENELFAELSSNPNLRNELKQFIDIERAARFDNEAYTPASESVASIFKTLNIDYVGTVTQPVLTKSIFSSLLGKYTLPIACSIASVIATVIVMLLLQNTKSNDVNSGSISITNSTTISREQNKNKRNEIPLIQSKEQTYNTKDTEPRVIVKYIERPVYIEKPQPDAHSAESISSKDNQEEIVSVVNTQQFRDEIEQRSLLLSKSNKHEQIISNIKLSQNTGIEPLEINSATSLLDNFSIFIMGSEYWEFPKSPVAKSSEPLFENSGIQLNYNLSSEILVGIDFRQEFFYQKYEGYESDELYNYHQHTNYISLGGIVRYQPFTEGLLNPFAQIYIGGNKVGGIGRLLVGLELSPIKDYCIVIGLEGSLLRYYHTDNVGETNYFYSPKLGLHYGIRFK